MSARLAALWVASLGGAAGLGWTSHGPSAPAKPPTATIAAPRAAAAPAIQPPLIAIGADCRATLRVEQQPIDWVLDQIAQQTGRTKTPLPHRASAAADQRSTGPGACRETQADPAPRWQHIEAGSEAERFAALMRVQADRMPVPAHLLQAMLYGGDSVRLPLAALEAGLHSLDADPETQRTVLDAALRLPDEAVRRETRVRLDEWLEPGRAESAARLRSP
jgi:hypothetical protein